MNGLECNSCFTTYAPLLNFSHFRLRNASKDVLEAVWMVSELWKHKNNVIFNRGVTDVPKIFALVQLNVWSWVTVKSHATIFFFSNWCFDYLVFCKRMICWCFFSGICSFRWNLRIQLGELDWVFFIQVEPSLKWFIFINFYCQ